MIAAEYEPYVIGLRRAFHRFPETGGNEKNTSERIKSELAEIGIPFQSAGKYGVVGTLDSGRHGKTLALRADIDALPVQEDIENLSSRKTVVSQVDGVSHLCGHDGHTAMLLGAARALFERRGQLNGKILFCFEMGEENGKGYSFILEALERANADGIWGIHLRWDLPSGKLSVEPGARMAGAIPFSVTIRGKGSHGSAPEYSFDPIECTAHVIVGLSSILSREIAPSRACVMTIGKLRAGTAANVIPETAAFCGSMRVLEAEAGNAMCDAFRRIVKDTADAHRCVSEIEITNNFLQVVNDPQLSAVAADAVAKAAGNDALTTAPPWMASDSMARYLDRYRGVYAFLGIRNETLGTGEVHHNPKFDIDEGALKYGVAATVRFALDFLQS